MNSESNGFRVGQSVDVAPYSQARGECRFEAGYAVVAVEFEDCIVERGGVRFAIGVNRMRASVAS